MRPSTDPLPRMYYARKTSTGPLLRTHVARTYFVQLTYTVTYILMTSGQSGYTRCLCDQIGYFSISVTATTSGHHVIGHRRPPPDDGHVSAELIRFRSLARATDRVAPLFFSILPLNWGA